MSLLKRRHYDYRPRDLLINTIVLVAIFALLQQTAVGILI